MYVPHVFRGQGQKLDPVFRCSSDCSHREMLTKARPLKSTQHELILQKRYRTYFPFQANPKCFCGKKKKKTF